MSRAVMVTTADNPYDYFTQFNEWYNYDVVHGYNTCAYLARVAYTSSVLNELGDDSIEDAVDEIVELNVTGNYVKVVDESND